MTTEVTHVSVTLDQPTLQTIKMGLAQLQMAAQVADSLLTQAVQAALDAAKPPAAIVEPPKAPPRHLKTVTPGANEAP